MSPEQASGCLENYSVGSEVFTLGILLYELLTGKVPFDGSNSTEIRRAIVQGRPQSLTGLRPKIASDLAAIVYKCLQKSAEHRYESVTAFIKDLQRYLDGQPVDAARPNLVRLALWNARKHPALTSSVLLTAMTILCAIVGVGYAGWKQRQSAQREYETKMQYVALFGKLIDDVVEGSIDSPTAISESLLAFEKQIENDLSSNPDDLRLQHLLSLISHYQSVNDLRMGIPSTAFKHRVRSVGILKKLRLQHPENSKIHFQYVYGIASVLSSIDGDSAKENVQSLQFYGIPQSPQELARLLLSEIDELTAIYDVPEYTDACNHFRMQAASAMHANDLEQLLPIFRQSINNSVALADKYPHRPLFIKHAIQASIHLGALASQQEQFDLARRYSDEGIGYFEKYLRPHFDQLWVRVFYMENAITYAEVLAKCQEWAQSLNAVSNCLEISHEIYSRPEHKLHALTRHVRLRALEYTCLEKLGRDEELTLVKQKLQESIRLASEYETTRKEIQSLRNDPRYTRAAIQLLQAADTEVVQNTPPPPHRQACHIKVIQSLEAESLLDSMPT